jgi:hypothetical protein
MKNYWLDRKKKTESMEKRIERMLNTHVIWIDDASVGAVPPIYVCPEIAEWDTNSYVVATDTAGVNTTAFTTMTTCIPGSPVAAPTQAVFSVTFDIPSVIKIDGVDIPSQIDVSGWVLDL